MAWVKRYSDELIVAVRAAAGTLAEVGDRFGITYRDVWRIKQGTLGYSVPYTPTVEATPTREIKVRSDGWKLSAAQHEAIRADLRRDRRSARDLAERNGVTIGRVIEIRREADFAAAKAAHEAASERDAQVVAGRVGEVEPDADVPLGHGDRGVAEAE